MVDNSDKKRRFEIVMKYLGFKYSRDFAKFLEVNEGSISFALKNKRPFSRNIEHSLFINAGVNSNWWETGEGKMFDRDIKSKITELRFSESEGKKDKEPIPNNVLEEELEKDCNKNLKRLTEALVNVTETNAKLVDQLLNKMEKEKEE